MTIEAELVAALMPRPVVRNSLTFFSLTFLNRQKVEQLSPRFWERLDEAILAKLQDRSSLSVKELSEMSGFSRGVGLEPHCAPCEGGEARADRARKEPPTALPAREALKVLG